MDIRTRELHYRWLDTPSEPVVIDEIPNPEPPPHPTPNDPPPTAEGSEDARSSASATSAI
jgi:hypothetical protein